MSILILTGPPASGKNTVASLIASQRDRCAIIDVDQVRWMLVKPHVAPWDGEEGKRQCLLGVDNACHLAKSFAEDGCDVIILDFVWDFTEAIYRRQLASYSPRMIQLMPSLIETLNRNLKRGWLPAHEVEMLYAIAETFQGYDEKINNSQLTPEDLAQILHKLMD